MSRTTLSDRGDRTTADDGGAGGGGTAPDDDTDGLRRALPPVGLLVAAGAGALLSVGAFLGLHVRPTSDDWCALWKVRDLGVLGITGDFYRTQNGRVTNAFLTGLLYSDGMRGPKLLPAFLVLALGTGLFLLGRAVLRPSRPPAVLLVAAAALLPALLFFAGTRTYQVLLWTPATISHTLPGVIGLWTVLGAVAAARSELRWARTAAAGSALLVGVASGMLSEPFSLVAGVLASAVGVLCLPRFGWARDRYTSTWCAAACLGLAIGLVILYTSPGARWRRSRHPGNPLSATELAETFGDWWRLWGTIAGQGAYLGAVGVGALIGLALAVTAPRHAGTGPHRPETGPQRSGTSPHRPGTGPSRSGADPRRSEVAPRGPGTDTRRPGTDPRHPAWNRPPRRLFLVAVLLPLPLIALASLAVIVGLRSGYGDAGWTYGRAWTSFLLPLLLTLCAYGAWGGYVLGLRLLAPGRPAARAAALVAAGAVAVGGAAALVRPVYALTTVTVVRGVAWDRQDARIRTEVAAGAREVAYRPYLIGGLSEPLFAPSYERDWAAQCAARYYRVDRIHRP
ncbi:MULTISPECIES: hypothetical protein [unclassified Streptomyces]|uniref:hypothetical protein n=1 Tax=unclassified Streptomyces TaxID=2593676 RepID=UPI00166085FC|nr:MULTISPECIES: hypothetical protein [unclassified Streptomyces]MBD0711255.1 hypothetical protein [Streptomyces sp. CBMA291]MBD0716174.1 hypothetical protein [Streptomyces sp. CBMA370]